MYIKFFRKLITVIFLALCTGLALADQFTESYNYDIKLFNEKIGYHTIKLEHREKGFNTKAITYYKIKAGSKMKEFSLTEEAVYGPTGEPRIYTLGLSIDDSSSDIRVTIYGDTAHIEERFGERSFVEKIKLVRPVYILERYMFGDYTILFRQIDFQSLKSGAEFDVLVPTMKKIIKLKIDRVKRDTLARRETYRLKGKLDEITFDLDVDVAMKNLVRVEFPSEGLMAMITDTPEEFPSEPVDITDLSLGKLFLKSSKTIDEPHKVNYLKAKAEIDFSTIGEAQNYLNNLYQSFVGAENPGLAYGEFKVRTPDKLVVDSVLFPHDYIKQVNKEYLSSDFMVPAADSLVDQTALRLSAGKRTVWDVVRAFTRFVSDSIKYYPGSEDALETLKKRQGNTLSKVLLHMALCRAVGIPARLVGGLVYANGLFIQHNWDEIYINENLGWVPVDPSLGEDEFFNATHISLWLGYGALNPSEKGTLVEVIEYKKKK